jgi:hypothetical protein
LLTLKLHYAKVTGVAFSPDGKLLATCGEDKRIIIYDGSAKTTDESGAVQTSKEKTFAFEMRDKPWKQVIEWFVDQSGLAFVGSRTPTGTFSFVGPPNKRYSLPEIIDILNEALLSQRQPYLLLRGERSFRLIPADEKVDPSLVPRVSLEDLDKRGNTELVSVKMVLKTLKARDLKAELKKICGPFGEVEADEKAISLTVQDTAGNVKRIIKAVREAEAAAKKKQP